MNLAGPFFRLIRWPNLLFIALTQLLFYFCVLTPHFSGLSATLRERLPLAALALITGASLLIAAAGYIINDYFDLNIDQVNKPEKMVIEKQISRRTAILLHLLLTGAGLLLSFQAARGTSWIILPANAACAGLLWLYSTTYKRKLLSGNVIISVLTAWVVLVMYVAVNDDHLNVSRQPAAEAAALKGIFKYTVLYAGFAFIISLIREVVKDIEDIQGDERYSCRTMPIVWGIPVAKVFAGVWMVVLAGAVAVLMVYTLLSGWWLAAAYALLFLLIPLLYTLRMFYHAQDTRGYHRVSSWVKGIMLLGILSMLPISYYL